ncbi:MFS transporter [Palleronia abyssalis]|uniref:Multidrug resistance protein MdtL n=1 Tax=Palleronia abyssalis TaxID=1501240 RepID=A0A2R8BVZ0_9RHOB|nr:MFS transporter [Palleronia abyssalis]SPJ24293.1 Multidrug resistance protein MdtL [Palleronia abyssalis]
MAATSTRADRAPWFPFIAGCFAFFTVMAGATVPTPLYPIYADTYGFSPIIITAIFAMYSAGVIGALLLTGPWSDQIGRKPLLLGGLALAFASGICFVAAQGLPLLLAARFLQGASVGIFTSAATLAVKEMAPESHPRIGAIGSTVANMGGLGMGSVIGGAVAAVAPDPLIFPYLFHLGMVVLATGLLWRAPEPIQTAENPKLRPQGLAVPSEVRGFFVPAAISAFAGFMICGFMGSITPSYLGQVLGFQGDHVAIGTVAGLIFLMSCFGQIAEDRLPEKMVLPIGMGVLTLGIAGITVGLAMVSLWALCAGIVVAGLGHGVAFKGGLSAIGRNSPEGQASAVTASYFTVAYVAISIPVLVVGALRMVIDLTPVSVMYAAASTILAALAFVLIRRRQQ